MDGLFWEPEFNGIDWEKIAAAINIVIHGPWLEIHPNYDMERIGSVARPYKYRKYQRCTDRTDVHHVHHIHQPDRMKLLKVRRNLIHSFAD